MIGWLANVLIVAGLWLLGEKRRSAFILTGVGEAVWAGYASYRGMWDLAAICVVFMFMAALNWWKWRGE